MLDTLPEGSVQCCVTSPPYWGLRSYLPDDDPLKALEIGSEPTVDEWVATMVDVFRRVRRVLRDDGTLFLNLGDSYAGSWGAQSREHAGKHAPNVSAISANQVKAAQIRDSGTGNLGRTPGLKPKDLIGQPWRVAFALQADGWWLRQEIIWSKANPMPESARDRCTKSHEHIFLLSKSEQYFWAFDDMQEPVSGGAHARRPMEYSGAKRPGFGHGYDAAPKPRYRTPDGWATERGTEHIAVAHANVGRRQGPPGNPAEGRVCKYGTLTGDSATDGAHRTKANLNRKGVKNNASMGEALADVRSTRNPRSVWHFPTEPFKGAHFATFPRELAQRCITAGTREGDAVLDPFGGSGTVGLVADAMHRSAVLIDLDRRNLPMAQDRIAGDAPLFAEVSAA
ncbi:MAG TPA: site-specific DNA-methyltransferase [Candidatus Limnocylindrales bacterium]|nr:site-specific DNA-methyltransferase [Candidatus Limnocylindrales bacterium]